LRVGAGSLSKPEHFASFGAGLALLAGLAWVVNAFVAPAVSDLGGPTKDVG
jgi:hypothetical protein